MEKVRVLEKELERYKKEGHKRKKLIMEQQHLIEAGADNFHKVCFALSYIIDLLSITRCHNIIHTG